MKFQNFCGIPSRLYPVNGVKSSFSIWNVIPLATYRSVAQQLPASCGLSGRALHQTLSPPAVTKVEIWARGHNSADFKDRENTEIKTRVNPNGCRCRGFGCETPPPPPPPSHWPYLTTQWRMWRRTILRGWRFASAAAISAALYVILLYCFWLDNFCKSVGVSEEAIR